MNELELREKKRMEEMPYFRTNHFVVDEIHPEGSVLHVDLGDEQKNPYGMAHGGLLYTLGDCVMGCTARCDGREYVTMDGQIHYLRSVKSGRITAKSRTIKRGKTTVVLEVEIYGEDERLLAYMTGTMFCTSVK